MLHNQHSNYPKSGKMNATAIQRLLLTACLGIAATVNTAAADSNPEQQAYVDSVHSWGSWELGIEPAAGPQAPPPQTLNYQHSNIQFRPNDNASFRVQAEEVTVTNIDPPPPMPVVPSPAPTPVVDATPLAPTDTVPTGGPLDNLF